MSITYKYSINTVDESGDTVNYVGNGGSAAAAEAEAKAKAGVSVIDYIDSVVEAKYYTGTDIPAITAATGTNMQDATFYGSRGTDKARIKVRNVDTGLKKNSTPGSKDRSLQATPAVQAVVTSHTDSEGGAGFVFDHAEFTE